MKTWFSKCVTVAVGSCCLASVLAAQSMELADGSGRAVLVQSVKELLDRDEAKGPALRLLTPDGSKPTLPVPEREPSPLDALVEVLRTLVGPTPGAATQVQRLGADHVVVMGAKEQIATIQAFLQHARANKDRLFQIDVQVVEVPEASYLEHFAELFVAPAGAGSEGGGKLAWAVVPDPAAAEAMLKKLETGANILQAPRLVVPNLQRAEMKSGEQISYIRDFSVRQVQGSWIAEPVVDVLEVGTTIDAVCAEAPDGSVLVDLAFSDQTVEKPLAEWKTKVAATGSELTVQMPRVTGCRASMKVLVASGSTVVVPAQRSNGNWLLVMATVQSVGVKRAKTTR